MRAREFLLVILLFVYLIHVETRKTCLLEEERFQKYNIWLLFEDVFRTTTETSLVEQAIYQTIVSMRRSCTSRKYGQEEDERTWWFTTLENSQIRVLICPIIGGRPNMLHYVTVVCEVLNEVNLLNGCHALILARGGSKGVIYKNLAKIDGLSLLSHSIIKIKKSECFENIWVSTDDKKIAEEAKDYGALVHFRPKKYAMDRSTSIEAVKEFLEEHKAINTFSLFQCTSVFLKEKYIKEAVFKLKSHDCVFAVKRTHDLRWKTDGMKIVPVNFNKDTRPRRQDWAGDIVETGMFYFSNRILAMSGYFQNELCATVEISAEDSLEIDSYRDLSIARCIGII